MKLHLTVKNLLAFFLFGCLMGEAHEISHFIAGKAACGCWPVERDFNAWRLCDCSLGYIATAAGPIFSMTLAWIGMFLLRSASIEKQSLGFVLIWANVPQARIATVLMGGGDERVVVRQLLADTAVFEYYKVVSVLIVLLMALPPIIAAFVAVKNRLAWLINFGFMIGALMVWGLYLFGLMNSILASGFLAETWIMGTPLLITLHTIIILAIFFFFRRELFTMVRPSATFSSVYS